MVYVLPQAWHGACSVASTEAHAAFEAAARGQSYYDGCCRLCKMGEPVDINATGQPDTPMEVINSLLGQSLQAESSDDMKELVQDAYRISNGLDPYLDQMLSPVPAACQDLITASDQHDWDGVYNEVSTRTEADHATVI